MKNSVAQHVPDFVDLGDRPRQCSDFDTVEELLAVEWVASWADACARPVFCKSRPWDATRWTLMVDGYDGETGEPWWWVVGYLRDGESVDLPTWDSTTREDLHR